VYVLLLFSVVVPHHHHEETACFTSTHCKDDVEAPSKHSDNLEDHNHDHKAGEEAKHCVTVEYYILSSINKSIKRVVDYPVPESVHSPFLVANKLSCEKEIKTFSTDFKLKLIPLENTFTVFVKDEFPLRGPPSNLT